MFVCIQDSDNEPDSRARLQGLNLALPFTFVALDNVFHLSVTEFPRL